MTDEEYDHYEKKSIKIVLVGRFHVIQVRAEWANPTSFRVTSRTSFHLEPTPP